MKKLSVFWRNLHFATQIKLAFFSIFIIPFLVICTVVSFYLKSTLETKTVNYMTSNLRQAARGISDNLQLYENSAFQTIFSPDFTEQITRLNEGEFSEYVYARQNILSSFRTLSSYYTPIHSMAIKNQGNTIWYGRMENDNALYNSHNVFLMDDSPDQTIFSGTGKWTATSYYSELTRKEYQLATYRQKYIDYNTNSNEGIYLMNIDLGSFQTIMAEAAIAENPVDNYLLIADKNGSILYAAEENLIGSSFSAVFHPAEDIDMKESKPVRGRHSDQKLILAACQIPNTDWYLIDILNQSYANREVDTALPLLLLLAAFLLISASAAVSWISKSMAQSVTEIVNTMQKVEDGSLSVKVTNKSKNEISAIGNQFNHMMDTIQNQISTIKTITERKKEAEISALENQIDPHFLYNTLDSINWMAIDNEQPQISSMICHLSALMRYRIKKSNSLVTLEEDVTYLERYLILQKNRYSDNFNYIIDIEPALKKCLVHKLIFQPFIENSLIHGFGQTDHGGILKILITNKDDDHLIFFIGDNGEGMEQAQLDVLLSTYIDNSGHIGIANVLNRLQLYYGSDFSISGTSQPGLGTEISIVIPKIYTPKGDCPDENSDC